MTLREQIQSDMKDAMRAHDAAKLSAIRMLWSSVKQKEVDDSVITAIIAKAVKERHDSIEQYRKGGREDLAAKEQSEIDVFTAYLPKPLSEEEINQVIDEAIANAGVSGMAAMGKVMGLVKPKLTGRADMSKVSAAIRAKLLQK